MSSPESRSAVPEARYDVAFYEAFEEEEAALKRYLPPQPRCYFTWKTIQESGHSVPMAPVISTRTQSRFPDDWIGQLCGIITRSTGYDHVTAYFEKMNQAVSAAYLPDYAARAVAEQAMLLWSALLRDLNLQQKSVTTFHRDGLTGREIRGKTIAVLGVGRIGSEIIDIANGLSMNILGVDIRPNAALADKYGFPYLPLTDALCRSDIAVCSMNLTRDNLGMLNYDMLKQLPLGALFINIARGEISPAQDLLALLNEGHLGGIALDVYDHEKELAGILRDSQDPEMLTEPAKTGVQAILALMRHPRAILTPHNAFNTEESVERKSMHTAQNLDTYLRTGRFLTPVPGI